MPSTYVLPKSGQGPFAVTETEFNASIRREVDAMEARVSRPATDLQYVGPWDPASGAFPSGVTAAGQYFVVASAGTVDGAAFQAGDHLIATVAAPSAASFAGNWQRGAYSTADRAPFGSIAQLVASSALVLGQTYQAQANADGGLESFLVVAGGTHTVNGDTVRALTGITGQAVSLRRRFTSLAQLLADTRPDSFFVASPASDAEGTVFYAGSDGRFDMALSGESAPYRTTAGGVKLVPQMTTKGLQAAPNGLDNALIGYGSASEGQIAGLAHPNNINAAWTYRHKGPIELPPGDYAPSQILDMGANKDKFVLRGAGEFSSRIRIPDGQYLYESERNPISIDFSGIHFVGGKGVLHLKNTTEFTRGNYVLHGNCFSNFTEAAIFCASPDFGRWDIRRNFFWARSTEALSHADITGIGIALAGWGDNSLIQLNRFHKVAVGFKLGRGAQGLWFEHNSFLRPPTFAEGAMTPIWMVPELGGGPYIGGLHIVRNRFGNEGLGPNDFHILVADEDSSSGTSFANRRPSTLESIGRIDGVTIAENWASGSSDRPFIYSRCSALKSWRVGNELIANMPATEVGFDSVVSPQSNWGFADGIYLDLSMHGGDLTEPPSIPAGFEHQFEVYDPLRAYLGAQYIELSGGNTDPGVKDFVLPSTPYAAAGTPVVAPTTDSMGGGDAENVRFLGDDTDRISGHRIYWGGGAKLAIGPEDLGRIVWCETEIAAGLANSLDNVGIGIRNSMGNDVYRRSAVVPRTGWALIRVPFIFTVEGNFTFSVHSSGWVAGSKEEVRVGRTRIYRADSPQDFGHQRIPDMSWNGAHVVMTVPGVADYHQWVDANGFLRGMRGAPTSDLDGVILSAAAMV